MRVCKNCGEEKAYEYLSLNSQGRKVYHDGNNNIWHGRNCHFCHLKYVKLKAEKTPLTTKACPACGVSFLQNNSKHLYCGKSCRVKSDCSV